MPHTQKSQAEKALDIVVSQGGTYAKDKWVATVPPQPNKAKK